MTEISLNDKQASATFIMGDNKMTSCPSEFGYTTRPVMEVANQIWAVNPKMKLPVYMG